MLLYLVLPARNRALVSKSEMMKRLSGGIPANKQTDTTDTPIRPAPKREDAGL
jgi:hypothetical protein